MSIASEITRINTNIANSYTAVDNKNGTLPQVQNSANLASAINSIEVIEQATAEGESLILTNTKAMPYKDYKIKGKSEQATRSGKNLCKLTGTAVTGISFVDSEISITGTFNNNIWQGFNSITLSAGTYTLSFISDFTNGTYFLFNNQQTTSKKVTITINETTNVSLGMVLFSGTYSNDNIKVQIEKNSTATSYEPYGVSPSPDYPSDINSVADDVNLCEELTNGYFSSQGVFVPDPYNRCSNYIDVIYGYKYILSAYNEQRITYSYQVAFFDENKNFINRNTISYDTSFEIQDNTIKYVRVWQGVNYSDTPATKIKLQKGTVATPYSPYNQGTVTIKQENIKNYLNWDKFIDYSNWTNSNSLGYKSFEITGLDTNKIYTLCRVDTAGYGEELKFAGFNKGNNNGNMFLHSTDSSRNLQSVSDTPSEDGKIYITMYMSSQSDLNDYINIIKKCWVIEGNDYEPYQGNDYTFQTEPLRSLPNGVKDTIEADGIHRRVGRIVLDGSDDEDWQQYANGFQYTYYLSISNCKVGLQESMCSHFQNVNYCWEANIGQIGRYSDHPTITNKYFNTDKSTLASWKEWLQENPITLIYELAEEIIEPLTQNQATTMLDITHTGSYENTTNIYTDEDVKPTIKVDYYKKG